ncbi:MAG: tetratricopeptide repeat protein [Hyphomicrobium sp.]|jgi:hypothetical protein
MRIFKGFLLLIGVVVCTLAPQLAIAGETTFTSAREALKQGISAYQGGYYELAIPALEFAAARNEFLASYYLARVYSDNTGSQTNHAKAYEIYEKIADEHIDADPDEDPRAPFVGKALTALAGYVRRGLPEIGLRPDAERAVFYLKNASTTFNDEDAQYELAKLQLKGEGVETNVALGRYWLSVLSKSGHAGAQAFLADLLWRGRHVEPDPARALALISLAVENAPQQDRLWIEDIYQNIYCGAGEGIRTQATGLVAQWGDRYGRKPSEARDRNGLEQLAATPVRTCQNGESVGPIPQVGTSTRSPQVGTEAKALPRPEVRTFSFGTASGLRDVGATVPPDTQAR